MCMIAIYSNWIFLRQSLTFVTRIERRGKSTWSGHCQWGRVNILYNIEWNHHHCHHSYHHYQSNHHHPGNVSVGGHWGQYKLPRAWAKAVQWITDIAQLFIAMQVTVMQCIAMYCFTLQWNWSSAMNHWYRPTSHCNAGDCNAMHCNVLFYIAMYHWYRLTFHCNAGHCNARHCNVLFHITMKLMQCNESLIWNHFWLRCYTMYCLHYGNMQFSRPASH